MSDESYWIERHTLATGRAKQAEQDRDLAREQRDGWIARAERAEAAEADLRQHILDIDAHATPYGDIPDEPGWVGTYLLTAGALHRALGKIGHSAPKCQAEEDLRLTRQAFEEYRASWSKATEATLAEVERLRATVERVRALVDEGARMHGAVRVERIAAALDAGRGEDDRFIAIAKTDWRAFQKAYSELRRERDEALANVARLADEVERMDARLLAALAAQRPAEPSLLSQANPAVGPIIDEEKIAAEIAALDSTTPPPSPEGEGARTLRADLADEADWIDERGGMISAAWVADGMRHLAQYGHRRPRAGESTHIHNAPAALDGSPEGEGAA